MSAITDSAKGEMCQVRIPTHCNYDPATTVFAHLNGAGMAIKSVYKGFEFGSYACSNCHGVLDDQIANALPKETKQLYHYQGMVRTIPILIDKGLI